MKYGLININRIIIEKGHDKSRCNSGEVVKLAKSIQKLGLLEPISVKELSGGTGYEILSGNKRYCALNLLGAKKVPCIIHEKSENSELIAISMQKYSKHNPFILADKIKRLLLSYELGAEDLAEKLGVETEEVIEYLLPSRMTQIEREMVINNHISEEITRKIAKISSPQARLNIISDYIQKKSSIKFNKSNAKKRPTAGQIKLFENTLKRSMESLENAGYKTNKEKLDSETQIEYKIRLTK